MLAKATEGKASGRSKTKTKTQESTSGGETKKREVEHEYAELIETTMKLSPSL